MPDPATAPAWPWGAGDPLPQTNAGGAAAGGGVATFHPGSAFAPDPGSAAVARAATRIFATADGALLLAHLRRITLNRALGPQAGDAALRMLEGQRALVLMLEGLARADSGPL
ncbi:MAG: hypothetical protein RLY86_4472 [Pseudomonadota bacterium]|jgi:hypothetical protein